jgi:dual-specificity kinase
MGELARGERDRRYDDRGWRSDRDRRAHRASSERYDRKRYGDWDTRHKERRSRSRSRDRRQARGYSDDRDYNGRRDDRDGYRDRDYGRRESWPEDRDRRNRGYNGSRDERVVERPREKPKKPRTPTPSESGSDSTRDDEIIHFDWEAGRPLGDYTMKQIFGDGTFGRCVHCTDRRDRPVAVKVIRDVPRYVDNAKIEVEVLEAIRKADNSQDSYCVQLFETFFHHQFFCLVFEPLAGSLYDLLKENNYRGMFLADIQTIGRQTAEALKFCASLQLTHTDLKPENILFQRKPMVTTELPRLQDKGGRPGGRSAPYLRPRDADIKVIDFGNATFAKDHHASIINTRQYRGPEVILGMKWNESSDLWSLGCILMELYGGELFFATHENLEHLALMEKTLGPMPSSFTARAKGAGKLLNSSGRLNWPEGASNSNSVKHVQRTLELRDQVLPCHQQLASVVRDMLQFEPSARPTAPDVLKHPFFTTEIPEV